MATLSTAARNAAIDAVAGLLDGGTIELQASDDSVVATLTFGTPAFGAAASGIATANAITAEDSAAAGTIDHGVYKNSGGAEVLSDISVSLTGGGGDIELTNLSPGAGSAVEITSATLTQPAS